MCIVKSLFLHTVVSNIDKFYVIACRKVENTGCVVAMVR